MAFKNDIKTAIDTDERQNQENSRSTWNRVVLALKRILAWMFVLGVTGAFVWGIYELYNNAELGANSECPSFDNLQLENAPSIAVCYLQEYATTITITAGNLLLPFLFSYVVEFEEYDQKVSRHFMKMHRF